MSAPKRIDPTYAGADPKRQRYQGKPERKPEDLRCFYAPHHTSEASCPACSWGELKAVAG